MAYSRSRLSLPRSGICSAEFQARGRSRLDYDQLNALRGFPRGGRGAPAGGTSRCHHTKTVALDAQQVQQLLISTMKDRPAYLGL
jgi:hypothetical protein